MANEFLAGLVNALTSFVNSLLKAIMIFLEQIGIIAPMF